MNKSKTSQKGSLGESIASRFLERKGFNIIDRNYRKPWGEIDLVAEKGGIVHFVEVKSISKSLSEGLSREIDYRPEEMATRNKLVKVARTAALYMETRKDKREYQIDVIGVLLDEDKKIARCRFFEQALEENL